MKENGARPMVVFKCMQVCIGKYIDEDFQHFVTLYEKLEKESWIDDKENRRKNTSLMFPRWVTRSKESKNKREAWKLIYHAHLAQSFFSSKLHFFLPDVLHTKTIFQCCDIWAFSTHFVHGNKVGSVKTITCRIMMLIKLLIIKKRAHLIRKSLKT